MATVNVTNRKAQPALRGQSVRVLLDASDSAKLSSFSVGDVVSTGSSKTGHVESIDNYGHSFKITPTMPTGDFGTTASPGVFAVSETVAITTT